MMLQRVPLETSLRSPRAWPALAGCGSSGMRPDWSLPKLGLASTRRASEQPHQPEERSYASHRAAGPLPDPARRLGVFIAPPIVAWGVVFLEDTKSNVFALDLEPARWLRLRHLFSVTNSSCRDPRLDRDERGRLRFGPRRDRDCWDRAAHGRILADESRHPPRRPGRLSPRLVSVCPMRRNRMARINACPALSGDVLLLGAVSRRPARRPPVGTRSAGTAGAP
jgi:hypothetical protein